MSTLGRVVFALLLSAALTRVAGAAAPSPDSSSAAPDTLRTAHADSASAAIPDTLDTVSADSASAATPAAVQAANADTAGAPAAQTTASTPGAPPAMPRIEPSGSPTSQRRGMKDTVTVIRGVSVEGAHKTSMVRSSASSVRLDRSAIARFLPSTPIDAMLTAPGVDLVKIGPWASRVSFRGFQGERVLVLVDGVRLNTGRGHGSNASLVSVDRLDQVELTSGAGGAEHGSDAIGGVINLVTHRPLFASQRSLSLTLSARGSEPGDEVAQTARLRLMSERFGAELSGGAGRLGALVTPEGRVPNSGSREEDLGARFALRLGEGSLDLEHSRHAARDVGLPALNGAYPLISRRAERAEAEMPFTASPFGWGIPGRARLLAVDQHYRTDFDETVLDTVISGRTHQPIAYHTTMAEDRLTTRSRGLHPEIRFGEHSSVRIAGELRREDTSGPKNSTITTRLMSGEVTDVTQLRSDNVPRARRDVLAGSVGSQFDLGPLRLESGARYDWLHSTADSTASSWSSALDVVDRRWSFDGGLAATIGWLEPYGRVASGFRAPNLEERYYRGPVHGGMDVFGDPELVPERSVTYEAGMRAATDGWGTVRVSAFRTQAEDFITLKYLLLANGRPRFQYANVERAQIDGVELTGRARIRSSSVTLSMTLPRGRDLADGTRLTDVGASRVTADFTSGVGPWLPSGLVALRVRWSDGLRADPLRVAERSLLSRPAFWTASVELGATVAGARATLAVRNLFDNLYREPLSFIDEPGRTFSFALKREFRIPVFEERREQER